MKLFLQVFKILQESCKKNLQDNFLARFDRNLAKNYLANFTCKILARNFISCKKSFIFSVRLARHVQDLVQDLAGLARKMLARFTYFLQDGLRIYYYI